MKKLLIVILPLLAVYGCATTSDEKAKPVCISNAVATASYTGSADECTCEAQSIIDAYNDQINTKSIVEINYSADNEMHAKSCQKAISAKESSLKIILIPEDGKYVYGYNYPMSKYTY